MATAVLDPDVLTGIKTGYFAWSAEDDRAYLITADGAIPADAVRVLTTLDDAQLARMGSDYFARINGLVIFTEPGTPVEVGSNGFEGQISGYYFAAARTVMLAGGSSIELAVSLPGLLDFSQLAQSGLIASLEDI